MIRRWLITLLLLLLALLATGWGCYRYHTVPDEECSELYRRYADSPHVSVAFIRDFSVNDTLSLDVTTLTALDSTGWDNLMHYFGFSQEMIDFYNAAYDSLRSDYQHSLIQFYRDRDNPTCRGVPDKGNVNYVVASIDKQTFCIYYIESDEQQYAIDKVNYEQLKKQTK